MTELEIPLTDEELRDSLPYVCYERSLFHQLKRGSGLQAFEWLYADRYLGFAHVDASEALRYDGDGLTGLVHSRGLQIRAVREAAIDGVRDLLAGGWGVRVMAMTARPDGSSYLTSTLIEELVGDRVIVTKTNAADRVTRKPVPAAEFFDRVPAAEDGTVELEALTLSAAWIADLNRRAGVDLFRAIMVETYGYTVRDGLRRGGHDRAPRDDGFAAFVRDVAEHGAGFAEEGIPQAWHLRLNKHIADKVLPVTNCWRRICADPGIRMRLGPLAEQVLRRADMCDQQLERVSGAFSFAVARPGRRTVDRLIAAISDTADRYRDFQTGVHLATLDLIGAEG